MGGLSFLFVLPLLSVCGVLLLSSSFPPPLLFLLLYALANAVIGIIDDGTKLKNKRNLGLLPWQKLFLQVFFAGAFLYLLFLRPELLPTLALPFTDVAISYSLPVIFLFLLFLVGGVNCANLTDGLDGLAASVSLTHGLFFLSEGIFWEIPALSVLGMTLSGSMLGFLIFNKNPAKIFMGDTGSLFLGALSVGGAFLLPNPAAALLYCFVFLLEGASVILQVLFFKLTKRRLFRMAPLHHHFEKCGWGERRIVLAFTLLSVIGCLFAHFSLL